MANDNQLLGQATIRVDGTVYKTNPGAKLNLGGVEREAKDGTNWSGYTEKRKGAELECEIAVTQGLSLANINAINDATITFEADTGQTWIIAGGWCASPAEVTDGSGMANFKFNGPPATEMT